MQARNSSEGRAARSHRGLRTSACRPRQPRCRPRLRPHTAVRARSDGCCAEWETQLLGHRSLTWPRPAPRTSCLCCSPTRLWSSPSGSFQVPAAASKTPLAVTQAWLMGLSSDLHGTPGKLSQLLNPGPGQGCSNTRQAEVCWAGPKAAEAPEPPRARRTWINSCAHPARGQVPCPGPAARTQANHKVRRGKVSTHPGSPRPRSVSRERGQWQQGGCSHVAGTRRAQGAHPPGASVPYSRASHSTWSSRRFSAGPSGSETGSPGAHSASPGRVTPAFSTCPSPH